MWAHTLSDPYLNVNADPCGHVTGSILNRNGRSRSLSTPKSCSTFNTLPSLNMALIGRGCISYSETWSLGSPYAGSAKIRLIHMGLLDHLWDDTVAGPRPDNGLSKLRKHHTFNFRPSSGKEAEGGSVRSYGDESSSGETTRVTRSIMIVKPPGYQSGSPPVSPAGSTPPVSPFSGAKDSTRFRRRSASDAYEKRGQNRSDPSSPYDV
ncbi:dormancy-associated protein homolog 3-like isoform X2 [Vigna umbellata]|uniref:dormancy-associated protein homolog 3-like isoform X2 n=1 Tax=Vigna umbellata TaxID=87088 RepID=UPI001F5F852C|nr:dormancy-associated protein homolog 3-like isoform X2 [Vigna umbellata]